MNLSSDLIDQANDWVEALNIDGMAKLSSTFANVLSPAATLVEALSKFSN